MFLNANTHNLLKLLFQMQICTSHQEIVYKQFQQQMKLEKEKEQELDAMFQ